MKENLKENLDEIETQIAKSNEKSVIRVMTIAGSDSGGGAGIQADLKTFAALGAYGTSVITALTAQNTRGVRSIFGVSSSFVEDQICAIMEDIGTDAIKIGMLHRIDVIMSVANLLKKYKIKKIVIDPVMVAKGGSILLEDEAIECLKQEIIPLAEILTPNIPEAEILCGLKMKRSEDFEIAAEAINSMGARSVLIKGGHWDPFQWKQDGLPYFGSDVVRDLLFIKSEEHRACWFDYPRIQTKNLHGTGCTLSSALAVGLAKGENIVTSYVFSRQYLQEILENSRNFVVGSGHRPMNHFASRTADFSPKNGINYSSCVWKNEK